MKKVKILAFIVLLTTFVSSMSACVQITVNTTSVESSMSSASSMDEKQESASSEISEQVVSEPPRTVPNGYTIPDTNMTVTIPEGATVLSVDTPAGDAAWSKAGILDASEKIKEMQKNGTTAEIIAANGDTIAVAAKSSDYANSVFNLNNLDEKGKKDFLKYMEPSSMDGSTTGTITWYDHAQIPFFMIDICAENIKEEGPVYERLYGTLYDGKIVSFDLFGDTKEISEETDAFMRAVVDSAVISAFAEAPTIENGLSRQSAVTLGAVGVLIVLLIVYFVTTHSRNKREKQLRKETADRLAEYRRSKQDDESVGTGALRFVNETDHDDAAIKTFANYQAYHLQIFMPVFTVVLSVIALYVVWQLGNFDSNWWVMLLLIGFAIYSLYKLATASTNTAKVLMRSYGKLRSRRAAYYFYDGDFRITGLQASNLHPYFQISRMYETNEYFYMYFGEGNTYFIRKDGFKQGDADAFRTFMKEKLGKRFK